jgi:cellobiose phosphorylase
LHYRYRETVYHIRVTQGESAITVDGVEQREQTIALVNDHSEHHVEIPTGAIIPATR